MTFSPDLRIKKNIMIKNFYYLLNLNGFFIVFHNNKNFTNFKNKILFRNNLKCFIIRNNLVLNIINEKNNNTIFSNLLVGPTGFLFVNNDGNLIKFFDYFFNLNSSEQLNFLLLGVYWRFKNRFFSLEYIFNLWIATKHFKSNSEFVVNTYIVILQQVSNPFFLLINLLNSFLCNFIICLSFLQNTLEKNKKL